VPQGFVAQLHEWNVAGWVCRRDQYARRRRIAKHSPAESDSRCQSIPEQRSQLDQSRCVFDTAARRFRRSCRAMLCVVQTSASLTSCSTSASRSRNQRTSSFALRSSTSSTSRTSRFRQQPEQRTADDHTAGVLSSGGLQPGNGFSQSQAGGTFGLLRQTVERTVGLGTSRQIQFALRLNF
jgi:hypothetical protein